MKLLDDKIRTFEEEQSQKFGQFGHEADIIKQEIQDSQNYQLSHYSKRDLSQIGDVFEHQLGLEKKEIEDFEDEIYRDLDVKFSGLNQELDREKIERKKNSSHIK